MLLTVFSAAIALALSRGRAPDCHCFGQLHSEPAGWDALVRNGLLAGLAALVAVAGWSDTGPGALVWVDNLNGVEILAGALGAAVLIVLALSTWVVLQVVRAYGRVLLRLEQVESALVDAGRLADEPEDELPEIGHRPKTDAPAFALVSDGNEEAIRTEAELHDLDRVLIDEELAVYGDYEANGTPSAVLVSPNGRIASWVASGPGHIARLVGHAVAAPTDEEEGDEYGVPVGEPTPKLALPDLEGRQIDLADLRGADIALLFWNPGCGYCRSMHEGVRAWEEDPPAGAPALVVVSSGEADETAEEGFLSRVLSTATSRRVGRSAPAARPWQSWSMPRGTSPRRSRPDPTACSP